MARKSRKIPVDVPAQADNRPFYAAVYIRLSVEDHKTGSISIETQKMIIDGFLERTPDILVYDTYIDNGATGTSFDRPGFQQMLKDIEAGRVNCVVVKDLSRLGRNTIDTGYYIEQYFRVHHVRFIAVNDQFDTADPESSASIILPLRNMINEAYAIDIGRKIKAQQRQAMRDGKFVGGRTPYGYLKAPDDCHQLVIDPVTAPVVRQIFQWAYEGDGLNTIARRLNEAGQQTPSHYKREARAFASEKLLGRGSWQTWTVAKILHAEVYTGDLVQGYTKIIDHKQVQAAPDERTIVRGTHEAIISREMFEAVQTILGQTAQRHKEKAVDAFTANPLKGKVFCGHCGGKLNRQRNRRKTTDDVYFYYCLTKSRVNRDACLGVMIRETELLSVLVDILLETMDAVLGQYALLLADTTAQEAQMAAMKSGISKRERELEQNRAFSRGLYENLIQGLISNADYMDMRAAYAAKIDILDAEIQKLTKGLHTLETQVEKYRQLAQDAREIRESRKLTNALLDRLVERVEVWPDKRIRVYFLFESEFAQYGEALKWCGTM